MSFYVGQFSLPSLLISYYALFEKKRFSQFCFLSQGNFVFFLSHFRQKSTGETSSRSSTSISIDEVMDKVRNFVRDKGIMVGLYLYRVNPGLAL